MASLFDESRRHVCCTLVAHECTRTHALLCSAQKIISKKHKTGTRALQRRPNKRPTIEETAHESYVEKIYKSKIVYTELLAPDIYNREQRFTIQMNGEILIKTLKYMHYFWVFLVVPFLKAFPKTPCMHSSSSHAGYMVCRSHAPRCDPSNYIGTKCAL
jgi:hypothetical protein